MILFHTNDIIAAQAIFFPVGCKIGSVKLNHTCIRSKPNEFLAILVNLVYGICW